MSTEATLTVRREELRRRVEALPKEVETWQERTKTELDNQAHFSQLQAIGTLMTAFATQQNGLLENLDPAGDATAFQDDAYQLVSSIIKSQRVWDFFRDKLDLRFSPTFKDVLWAADTIAWNCYGPVLDRAVDFKIKERATLREPPLTYLTAEFSPATWMRGSRPNDGRDYFLGTASLPIPVIELPWDHIENAWELLSLHHEVGHDLEADLNLRAPIAAALKSQLAAAQVPPARIKQWHDWQAEVFADLVGLQLGGPTFAEALMHLLLLPAAMVTTFNPSDPHPTHYPRILMNAAYIPTLIPAHQPLVDDGQRIAAQWVALYGEQSQFEEVVADFSVVSHAMMDTPFPVLQGKTVRELMPYLKSDDFRIRGASKFMRTGQDKPTKLEPRHCVSAARLAVTEAAEAGTITPDLLTEINQRTLELVRSNAQGGLRGESGTPAHKAFIASFVDTISLSGGS
jgi:hypothetical protein